MYTNPATFECSASLGDDNPAVGVPDQDNGARLGINYHSGSARISRQRDRRILHDADVEAVLFQDVINASPAGAVHKTAVDKDNILYSASDPPLPNHVTGFSR